MANSTASALTKRKVALDLALMPPPPVKRIKRPTQALNEDDYTTALSAIIARDYFPGLLETQAQQEYLTALESNNDAWIAEAGQKLRDAMTPAGGGKTTRRRSARNTRFDGGRTPSAAPAGETPRGWTGGETPGSVAGSERSAVSSMRAEIDTTNLSLGAFQAKYTSEDNESFNALLDKQNEKKRAKHAYLYAPDGRLPSARQIADKAREQRLLRHANEADDQTETDESTSNALILITTGAISSRPAAPSSWRTTRYDNTFMFPPDSVDELGHHESVADVNAAKSKAPPKAVVHANTRFPPRALLQDDDVGPVPPSPSLDTSIIRRRDAAREARSETGTETEYPGGGETPRVNGYAFVDEDEPEDIPQTQLEAAAPSYRDLLAGQVGDGGEFNPFRIAGNRRREELHHRLVERENAKKRTVAVGRGARGDVGGTPMARSVNGGQTPGTAAGKAGGNMTPAARSLMAKLGKRGKETPSAQARMDMLWTPGRTPRRAAAGSK